MKYKVYLSVGVVEALEPDEFVGEADTVKDIIRIMHRYLDERGIRKQRYWRYIFDTKTTVVDYGSWSHFFTITPALTMEELTKGTEE